MQVSLIITTCNRPDALLLVLKSIELQSVIPNEIIIADDGSSDSTKKCIASFKKKSNLRLIHSWQSDKGFRVAESRNKAILQSSYEYIILIDGDMLLHQKYIEDHINNSQLGFFVQGPRVFLNPGVTKNALKNSKTNFSFFSKGLRNRKNSLHSTFFAKLFESKKNHLKGIKACNLAFYKEDCIEINGFNNDMKGWGREDSEFVARLINNGIRRKNVHFSLIQFHLWHQKSEKNYLLKNEEILQNTIKKKLKTCANGLNYFTDTN